MEIRLSIKQLLFVSVWLLIVMVALLLSTTRSYMDLQGKAETFGELLLMFGISFGFFVLGLQHLSQE